MTRAWKGSPGLLFLIIMSSIYRQIERDRERERERDRERETERERERGRERESQRGREIVNAKEVIG